MARNPSLEMTIADAKNGAKNAKKVFKTQVVRHDGGNIMIPHDVPLTNVVESLQRQIAADEEKKEVSAAIPAFPYDGAHAMHLALEELFGFVISENMKTMFGNTNQDITLTINAQGDKVTVPWGRFSVPGIEGLLMTSYQWEDERVIFQIRGEIKGKHQSKFDTLVERTKQILLTQSIYKGKVLRAKFTDNRGDRLPVPEISFTDASGASAPIFNEVLTDKLEYDLLSYIQHQDLARKLNGGTLKRGVLLAGPYGTGKTLTAAYVSKLAEEHGMTFIYADKPHDFYDAHLLARAYQPAVIFVEDVEYIVGTDRTEEVNKMLNVLDGPDTKHYDIMTIFTTNHGEKINPAMFRPGRVDVTLVIDPPDAAAAIRLARYYAENLIEDEDFTEAGERLSGKIPATIKEAVSRARLRAAMRTGDERALIRNSDLVGAADSIENERTSFQTEMDDNAIRTMGLEIGRQVLAKSRQAFGNEMSKDHASGVTLR